MRSPSMALLVLPALVEALQPLGVGVASLHELVSSFLCVWFSWILCTNTREVFSRCTMCLHSFPEHYLRCFDVFFRVLDACVQHKYDMLG